MQSSRATLILALTLAGCASGPNPWSETSNAGADQLLKPDFEPFSSQRLARMINAAAGGKPENAPHPPLPQPPNRKDEAERANAEFDMALATFGRRISDGTPRTPEAQSRMRAARNEIQGQLIAASINRCNEYKTYLRRGSSRWNFYLGAGSTVFGTVGALVTNGAAQIFSGVSGALTGINAGFQNSFLSSVATSVIIPGIDKQRGALLSNIAHLQCLSLGDYPLSMALADALTFHGQCSIDVGVAAAGQSIARVSTAPVGLQAARNAAAAVNAYNAALSDRTATKAEPFPEVATFAPTLGEARPIVMCPPLDAKGRLGSLPRRTNWFAPRSAAAPEKAAASPSRGQRR